jgi:putative protease
MKSAEYVGAVVSAYRLVIDNLAAGEESQRRAMADARSILKNDFARSKTVYLINGNEGISKDSGPDWLNPKQNGGTGISLGTLLRVNSKARDGERQGLISRGLIVPSPGDSIRFHRADDSDRVSHKLSFVEDGPDGASWISVPEGFGPGDSVYLIQTKAMTRRYAPIVPRNQEETVRVPGPSFEKAPQPGKSAKNEAFAPGPKTDQDFRGGLYVMVSRPEDLFILQSSRPVKAILPCCRKTVKQLLGGQSLPFSPGDIILSLDPFFPEEDESGMGEAVPALTEKGYTRFIVNNLGHFSLFRGSETDTRKKAVIIAGPWLYTFNAWAWNFIARCGAVYCVSPLENNRQNLEKTFPGEHRNIRNRVFITVLGRPGLFRVRGNLGGFYGFEHFSGQRNAGQRRDETFRLAPASGSRTDGCVVYPREYFSITDKIPFLREAGFSRFILDLSSGPLKKAEYRNIMEAVNRATPIPGASRFNWKNGFFREPASEEKAPRK